MNSKVFFVFLIFLLLFGCNSSNTSNTDTTEKKEVKDDFNKGSTDPKLVGNWRSYSDIKNTKLLELYADGKWVLGTSSGSWRVTNIKTSDWAKWGIESYGPSRKIILEGWNDDIVDGPVEEAESNINFFWVIYDVTLENYGEPNQIQVKYGHANWD